MKIFLCAISLFTLIAGCQVHNTYYIELENTYGLKNADPVFIQGKEVGEVSAIDLKDHHIIVAIKLNKKYNIYKNSVVTVKSVSLLGDKSIDIIYAKANIDIMNNNDTIIGKYNDDNALNRIIKKVDTLMYIADSTAIKKK